MTPTAEQLDHLIGHTSGRALTPDEHAALRAGVRALRAVLAGSLEATLSATLGRPSLGTYHQQVVKQLATAEDELAQWRQRAFREADYRERAEQAEARIAAAYGFADEMATYCSPHGVASLYADRLRAVLDGAQP
ncbi:hypothetical protein ACGF07_25615 [Kitasatospora sp. NPDC048194]|uniref:hypothetical protein n=1 Tax=Kitasatospora sp. NPDC048194 TaxID=3364045 RepID=UPI003719DF79